MRRALTLPAVALLTLLAGCGESPPQAKFDDLHGRTVCTLGGRAYFSQVGVAGAFRLTRTPEIDTVCALPR